MLVSVPESMLRVEHCAEFKLQSVWALWDFELVVQNRYHKAHDQVYSCSTESITSSFCRPQDSCKPFCHPVFVIPIILIIEAELMHKSQTTTSSALPHPSTPSHPPTIKRHSRYHRSIQLRSGAVPHHHVLVL